MVILAIAFIILAIVALILASIYLEDFALSFWASVYIIVFLICGIEILSEEYSEPTPTAKDVYEGKTTLEITYRDSILVDTVVVFKNSKK